MTTTDAVPLQINIDSTCMNLLVRATEILDLFQRELHTVCVQWSTVPIQQLLSLFPDIQSAEVDIHILKSLIDPDIILNLMPILNFWKQRSYLQHICQGIKNLFSHLQLSFEQNPGTAIDALNDLLTINEQTIGELCFNRYQRYITACGEFV